MVLSPAIRTEMWLVDGRLLARYQTKWLCAAGFVGIFRYRRRLDLRDFRRIDGVRGIAFDGGRTTRHWRNRRRRCREAPTAQLERYKGQGGGHAYQRYCADYDVPQLNCAAEWRGISVLLAQTECARPQVLQAGIARRHRQSLVEFLDGIGVAARIEVSQPLAVRRVGGSEHRHETPAGQQRSYAIGRCNKIECLRFAGRGEAIHP